MDKVYEPIIATCKDCGEEFTIKVGEQKFYEEKGLQLPVRCKSCRDVRKKIREEKTQEEKNAEFERILEEWKKNTVHI